MGGDSTTLARKSDVLSLSCLIVLQRFGLALAGRGGLPQVNLAMPHVVLLAAVAEVIALLTPIDDLVDQVAHTTQTDPQPLRGFVTQLRDRQLLVPAEAAPDRNTVPVAWTPPPSAPAPADQPLVVSAPLVFRPGSSGFELLDHNGITQAVLTAAELVATTAFCEPLHHAEAFAKHRRDAGPIALAADDFDQLLGRLAGAGVLRPAGHEGTLEESGAEGRLRRDMLRITSLGQTINADVDVHRQRERERSQSTGVVRTNVVPVQHNGALVPLALGMLFAYVKAFDGGRLEDDFHFLPQWVIDEDRVRELLEDGPAVFLFSNYDWSHEANLRVSKLVKDVSPASVTIHGGPDTPKYEGDVGRYFATNSHIDVAVRGEGELTCAEALAALAGRIGSDHQVLSDLSALSGVTGLSYRGAAGIVTTEGRDRIADLDTIPSPFLTGLFDAYDQSTAFLAVLETNRGCPYGCTYCDWGSSTLSRIRKFSLDRIFAELEWCAQRDNDILLLADANFGIFERDVEIADKVAEMKGRYGSPRVFVTNYAKNTVKHLRTIVTSMVEAGILAEGLLSLQTMDDETLATVKRSNIKTKKYDELAVEFRRAGLPLYIDLMLGLPGSTTDSFANDLQQCVDREVTAKIFPTQMLVNSPMNEPAYRAENAIEFADGGGVVKTAERRASPALVVSSASFTRADYEHMKQLRQVYLLAENFGVLRHVMRFVRQETGTREIDFLIELHRAVSEDRESWPIAVYTLEAVPSLMTPPASWKLFLDEIRRYLVERVGIADDAALRSLLDVQHALLPAGGREFPVTIDLAHDYAAWYEAMVQTKFEGHLDDWPARFPRLRDFGPAEFEIDDPALVCRSGLGFGMDFVDPYENWELASPVGRAVVSHRVAF